MNATKTSNNINGNGRKYAKKDTKTRIITSPAKMFPKSRRAREKGLITSSSIFKGAKIGIGWK